MTKEEPVPPAPGRPRLVPRRMPPLPGRTPRSRIWIGTMLTAAGALLLFLALVPLHFLHRVSDRTDVPGTVQQGYYFDTESVDSQDGVAELDDGEYGYWKVDYEIDGTPHTGLLPGRYSAGQQVMLSAPGDGNVFRVLAEADPSGVKVLSWFAAVATVAALGVGLSGLVSGMRMAARRHQLEANAAAAAAYGVPVSFIEKRLQPERSSRWTKGVQQPESAPSRPAPSGRTPPRWQQTSGETSAPDGFFHRPYDLDDS